ncbi:type III secretion system translocon subunit SctE [Pectobacterium brasiliense]|uniref:type III secretion system translocon subunit SctE n=1 Tax=Pectobacterium brasiliense TaxID=180957 RepID=UPI001968BA27|nr:type III secretion system translocon subunit SctE [Pectobacterium brasiliense]MBN3264715.1 type III secretion system translocon subunit SctE [Pectobacterium brasiliense]
MNIPINGFGALNYLQISEELRQEEVSQEELKRQSKLARRFGNSALKKHPQLGQVKSAMQVLEPGQLMKVLQNTHLAMNGNGESADLAQQDIPQLKMPQGGEESNNSDKNARADKPLSASAKMSELLGKIAQLINDTSIEKLNAQVSSYNAMMEGMGDAYSELAKDIETQSKQHAANVDSLKVAQNQANKLEQDVNNAQSSLNKAQDTLSDLQRQAAGQNPVSPELEQQIDEAKNAVAVAQANLASAKSSHDSFVAGPLAAAIKAENASRLALESTQVKSKAMVDSLSPQQQSAVESQRKQSDENVKTLTFLMALISQLLSRSADEELSASADLKMKLAEAAAKDAEKKAKEYDEQVRKAEELQKTMGCIAKVLGWAITVVGFAGALFTGGASLAIAGIGLALAIGDEICQAVNDGYSFMQAALKPLMEHVIQPLMEFMAKQFTAVFEALGLDKNTAELMGKIFGAISTAVIMIAAVMVAGSAASKLGDVVMKKLGGDVVKKAAQTTINKMMDNAVGDAIKKMSGGIGRMVGMDSVKMAQWSVRVNMTKTIGMLANTSIQTAGNVVAANMMINAAKIRASILNNITLQHMLNEMMDRVVDNYSTRMETANAIIKNISNVADDQMKAGKYIVAKISVVAS